VAAGVRSSYFGHDEFARWAPGMKTISDALAIRRRVYGAFEMAATAPTPEERRAYLTFALVGAGPTGVELAGQIREVATKTLNAEFRTISPEDARVLLFDGGSAPLAVFGPKLSRKAAETLQRLGVEQHMGSIVTHVDRVSCSSVTRPASRSATTPTPCSGPPA
jgi:NADH dehydrogenase